MPTFTITRNDWNKTTVARKSPRPRNGWKSPDDERPMTIGTVADLEEAIKRHPYMTLQDRFEFRLQNVANLLSDEQSTRRQEHDHPPQTDPG